ncbi:hypothetical protein B7494_g8262 [Chlorociboria aeruginascens]|nr:hypothetical protein B7494_g8262 [Chlorociboria aeruginascens]
MALSNFGSLVLQLLMFITTLVNFNYALTTLDSLLILALSIQTGRRRTGLGSVEVLEVERQAATNGAQEDEGDEGDEVVSRRYGFRDRVGCYTWTWFTMTMATGGIANVLHSMSVTLQTSNYSDIRRTFPIHTMTPIWIFPAYPLLLIAPFASNLIDALPSATAASRLNSVAIALGAVCIQGTGFLVSLMIYSAFIYRLMTQKLPRETARPGMFVSVGPSGFTVAGLVHLGNDLSAKIMPDGYMGHPEATVTLKLLSDVAGLWMWGLCLWFFIVSVGAHWQVMRPNDPDHHLRFDMTWYSFVFPNTALVTATQAIGKSLESRAIQIFGTVMAALLVLVWIFVFAMMVRAFLLRRLLWPGDVDASVVQLEKWRDTATAAARNSVINGN